MAGFAAQFLGIVVDAQQKRSNDDAVLEDDNDTATSTPVPEQIEELVATPPGVPKLDLSGINRSQRLTFDESVVDPAPGAVKVPKVGRSTGAAAVGSVSRRARTTLSLPSEVRTDTDLAVLDDIMWASPACAQLTRSVRLRLARGATLATFDEGQELTTAGEPMTCVLFVTSGEVAIIPEPSRTQQASHGANSPSDQQQPQTEEQQHHQPSPQVVAFGASLGTFQQPAQLDPLTPRTRQWGLQPPQPCWPFTAAARGGPVECAVVPHAVWAAATAESPHWDAREVASFLEDVPLFGCLTSAQLMAVARQVRVVKAPAGNMIYRQGSDGDDVYVIRSGYVRLLRELHVRPQTRDRLNRMTLTMAGLRVQLDTLATPRRWLPPFRLPAVEPHTPGSQLMGSDLGSEHASGAHTHRPRLEGSGDERPSSVGSMISAVDSSHAAHHQGLYPHLADVTEGGGEHPHAHAHDMQRPGSNASSRGATYSSHPQHPNPHHQLPSPRPGDPSAQPSLHHSPSSVHRRRSKQATNAADALFDSMYTSPAATQGRRPPSSSQTLPGGAQAAAGTGAGGEPGSGAAGDNAEAVLGRGALLPFIHHTPRTLKRAEGAVFAEQGLLGAGRVFGEGLAGPTGDMRRSHRTASAVADTQVELVVFQRSEIEGKLGNVVSFLWANEPPGRGGTGSSSRQAPRARGGSRDPAAEAAKVALQKSMAWEIYKKKLVKDVFIAKNAKAIKGSMPSMRGY